ncbi:hypothetical protein HY772_09760 [Candidatus Woesearchaeota archaeon]|nr:hypothetical protein [Candidatus Woesearchaeota archaeon]
MVVRTEIQLPNGTKVVVEGTEEEVIRVAGALQVASRVPMRHPQDYTKKAAKTALSRAGPVYYWSR